MLSLADLKNCTEEEVKRHIAVNYSGNADNYPTPSDIAKLEEILAPETILIAYESVGSWGCDSSSYYLIQNADGELYEVRGSHCSCHGFEGQYYPEPVTVEYLNSDRFEVWTGGYDDDAEYNKEKIKEFVACLVQ